MGDLGPVTSALTFMGVVPVTGLCVAVAVFHCLTINPLKKKVIRYSNVTIVDEPLAFTVPFNVAPVEEMLVAADVAATGT